MSLFMGMQSYFLGSSADYADYKRREKQGSRKGARTPRTRDQKSEVKARGLIAESFPSMIEVRNLKT
jgi:hypothetical protein